MQYNAKHRNNRTITRVRHPNNILHNSPSELLRGITRVMNIKPITSKFKRLNFKFCTKLKHKNQDIVQLHKDYSHMIHIRTFPTSKIIQKLKELYRNSA